MRRPDICLYVGPADRAELRALLNNRNIPRKLAWRAEIVLATADGQGTVEIMRRTGMSKPTVWRWQERYLDEGVPGLKRDKTRPSRVPPLPREVRLKVIAKTVKETPPNATHWSRATMAQAVGISPSSVGRIWAEAGLKPHIVRRFKVSNDPMFEAKVTEIVGLYLDPPERAVVLCVDEKSQIQALVAKRPQRAAQRLGADRDAEFLPHPLRQIDQSPAHHAVDGRDRAALHHLRQRLTLGRPQLRRRATRLAVDQPRGTLGVEAHHPVPNDLQRHAADFRRLAAGIAVIDRRQRQQPTGLRPVS